MNWERVWVRIEQVPFHRVTYVGLELLPLQLAGAQVMPVLNDVGLAQDLAFELFFVALQLIPGALRDE